MKAIVLNQTGEPEVMQCIDVPRPRIGKKQALVRLHYAGINFIDVYFRNGVYPVGSFPFIPGKEGSGEIVEIGRELSGFKKGDRVVFPFGGTGTYCEYTSLEEGELVRLPENVSYETGAACILQGLTAHYLCNSTFAVEKGQIVLIHAGAGGVGQLLIQMCKSKGAVVYTTVSTEAKKQKALKAGADHVILYNDYKFSEEFLNLTGGEKAHVVFDSVAKETFEESLSCIRLRGLMVLYGNSSGVVPPFQLNRLNALGGLYVTRPSLGQYIHTPQEMRWRCWELFQALENGLKIEIGKVYPLEQAVLSHRELEGRVTTGKNLLKID